MYVALGTDNQLWQFDVSAGFIRTLNEDPGPVSDYSISEDSKLLYSTTSLTGIYNSIVKLIQHWTQLMFRIHHITIWKRLSGRILTI